MRKNRWSCMWTNIPQLKNSYFVLLNFNNLLLFVCECQDVKVSTEMVLTSFILEMIISRNQLN